MTNSLLCFVTTLSIFQNLTKHWGIICITNSNLKKKVGKFISSHLNVFSSSLFTWIFDLHCSEWFLHSKAVFTLICCGGGERVSKMDVVLIQKHLFENTTKANIHQSTNFSGSTLNPSNVFFSAFYFFSHNASLLCITVFCLSWVTEYVQGGGQGRCSGQEKHRCTLQSLSH